MDKKLIVANWKSHKTVAESQTFLKELQQALSTISLESKEIVICPSFSSLSVCSEFIKSNNLPVKLGAQDISPFDEGAYTGEVSGKQIKELADYVIIGHSERRKYFKEGKDIIAEKINQARENNLSIILCVQDEQDEIIQDVSYIAYEPPTAISTFGTGVPDDPAHVQAVFEIIRQKTSAQFLYGGSVKDENIAAYAHLSLLSGFLVGGASLQSSSFIGLLAQW